MNKPDCKPTPSRASEQVLAAFRQLVSDWLPLELQHTRLTRDDLTDVLTYAAVQRLTLESACQTLSQAPSGNRLREVLKAALPPWPRLQDQLNALLAAQLPPPVRAGRQAFCLAGDLTLIPYHGQPERDPAEVVRAEAKAGTSHFHAYATLAIVHHRQRYVLALRLVRVGDSLAAILRDLLDHVQRLNVRVRRLLLDKGFCAVAVFRLLDARGLSYIVPVPVRGRSGGIRRLRQGHRSYTTRYTLQSRPSGDYPVQVVVVRRYYRGRYGKHGVEWFVYAVAGLPAGTPPQQVYQLYRQRFGIETSYRQMHQVRVRTTSRSPGLRLLLVGLAFALVNLYVALRHPWAARPRPGRVPRRHWLGLRRLALQLAHALERCRGRPARRSPVPAPAPS